MAEEVAEFGGGRQGEAAVARANGGGLDFVAERCEEAFELWRRRGHAFDLGAQGERGLSEFWLFLTGAAHGGAEYLRDGDAEERGGGVGAVVDVLGEQAFALVFAAHEGDGVHIEEEGASAALVGGFGVEDAGGAKREVELLGAGRVLGQQKT